MGCECSEVLHNVSGDLLRPRTEPRPPLGVLEEIGGTLLEKLLHLVGVTRGHAVYDVVALQREIELLHSKAKVLVEARKEISREIVP